MPPYPAGLLYPPGPPVPPPEIPPAGTDQVPANAFSSKDWPYPQPQHFSISLDYLLWWMKNRSIPPLITTGPASDPIPGALGAPGTQIVLGPGGSDVSGTNGVRLSALWWFDETHHWAADGSFFQMEQLTKIFTASSAGGPNDPVLSRPYTDANTGIATVDPVALPNLSAGNIVVSMPRRFYGADANLRYAFDVDALATIHVSYLMASALPEPGREDPGGGQPQ